MSISSSIWQFKAFASLYTVSACAFFISLSPCSYFWSIRKDTPDAFASWNCDSSRCILFSFNLFINIQSSPLDNYKVKTRCRVDSKADNLIFHTFAIFKKHNFFAYIWQSTLQMIQCNHLVVPFLCRVAVSLYDFLDSGCIFRLENTTTFLTIENNTQEFRFENLSHLNYTQTLNKPYSFRVRFT